LFFKPFILLCLIVVLSCLSTFKAQACVVGETIQTYEQSRQEKQLSPNPFYIKHHPKERVFEKRYNLGSDLVLRLYTAHNSVSASIYQADLFLGSEQALPGTPQDINQLIHKLSCGKASGVPEFHKENTKELLKETLTFPSGVTVIKLHKGGKLYVLQVIDRSLKRKAFTE